MARLCVCNAAVSNPDPVLDAMRYKVGDVIDILPDGWVPRPGDAALPITIVDVPGVAPDVLSGFLTGQSGDPQLNTIPRRRAFSFNLTAWQASGGKSLDFVGANVMRVANAPIINPSVLGATSGVL